MYSRILVAVDDSEPSMLAMQEAIKLTKDQGAKLRIVFISDMFLPAGEGVPVDFKSHEINKRQEASNILNKMLALAHQSNISAESRSVEILESDNHIPEIIVNEADKWGADLIVLGTHGRSGLTRLLLGSVAEEVVRKTNVPVHIVRSQD